MTPCPHAKVCRRRMRNGDHPDGCTAATLAVCSPDLAVDAATFIPARYFVLRMAVARWDKNYLAN